MTYAGMIANKEDCDTCGNARRHNIEIGWWCPDCSLVEWNADKSMMLKALEDTQDDLNRATETSCALLLRLRRAEDCLRELVTVVRGECPSLLDETRGGDANLDMEIDEVLLPLPKIGRKDYGRE